VTVASPQRAAARRAERGQADVDVVIRDLQAAPATIGACADPLGEASVWVAYCCPGQVDAQFASSLTSLQLHDAKNHGHLILRGGIILSETGPRIAHARNALVREFLANTEGTTVPTYLLMIDSDMGFTPVDVQQLLDDIRTVDHPKPGIVGGLCFGGGHSSPMFPTVYGFANEDDAANLVLTRFSFYPPDELFAVHGTGAAFTLINRELLVEMAAKFDQPTQWYAETVRTKSANDYGEDIVFCLRAHALGWGTWVDSRVKIDHYKRGKLNETVYVQRLDILDAINAVTAVNDEPLHVEAAPDGDLVTVGH
jgi:hypothetical protein